jgi:DNA-binding beta-propeller fold protein YncE
VLLVIQGPTALDPFRRPLGLVADSTRNVLVVADTGNHRLVMLDATGRSRGSFSYITDETRGRLCEPRSVALDARGRFYVVDALASEIEVLTSMGSHLAFIAPALPPGVECRPQSVALGRSGRLYLACGGGRPGLAVVETNGALATSIGFAPADSGDLRGPVSVAVNADESEIALVDPQGDRAVHVYSVDGRELASFGTHGAGEGTCSLAAHAAWGPDGTLWITDTLRHCISVFDSRGRYLGAIGGFGHAPGELDYPVACAFLSRHRLAVLDRVGARLQLFELEAGQAQELQPGWKSNGSGSTGTTTNVR